MGARSRLSLASIEFVVFQEIDPNVLTIFGPNDKHLEMMDREQWQAYFPDEGEWFEGAGLFGYGCNASTIKHRLEMMGFSLEAANRAFWIGHRSELRLREDFLDRPGYGSEFKQFVLDELSLFQSAAFSPACWIESLRKIIESSYATLSRNERRSLPRLQRFMLEQGHWHRFGFPGHGDVRFSIRLALEALRDEDLLFYNLTEFIGGHAYKAHTDLFNYAEYLRQNGYRVIVLTEGSTDKWILQRSLNLLFPHVSESFVFMDFEGARIEGGAGALANMVKAFAGAGIENQTVAIFDNDTAGRSALRKFQQVKLPSNIVVLQYPDLPLASHYPTQGPTGDVSMNINGLACSLELYLGEDVLKDEDNCFLPIRWRGYDEVLRAYQGEIANKKRILERFEQKLIECENDNSKIDAYDWSGIFLLLNHLCNAFATRLSRTALEFEKAMNGRSEKAS